jgi:hypothetical protein
VRLGTFAAVIAFHVSIYSVVNSINAARDPAQLWDLYTRVDSWIPYVGWSSFIYYFGDLYMGVWGGFIVMRLERGFGRAMKAYLGMIIAGGAFQLLIPARAPLPEQFYWLQGLVHQLSIPPYANLPSMHVALSMLAAGLALHVLRSRPARWFSTVVAVLITASTVTTKEHFFVDAVAGVALAALAYAYWRGGAGVELPGRTRVPADPGPIPQPGVSTSLRSAG